ncbi:MAG TPA: cysteine desulfurase family protein, partial [archaeon]|nr:cysteine desulfurase family protein [archaeon]
LKEYYGNPSSGHWLGKQGKNAIEKARNQVASLIGAKPNEIIFTSGGSESNNQALKGIAFANNEKGNHIITSIIEHPAIINPCKYLETKGFKVTYVGVDEFGRVNPRDIEKAITDETILISIMHANNETGTIQPIAEIGKIARKNNICFHTDAAQSVGKIQIKVKELNADLLSIAGHKFYAPKGIGALYIKEGTKIESLIHGASHEMGKRAGTENTASIVGLGEAGEIAEKTMNKYNKKIQRLRNQLHKKLVETTETKLNGHPTKRLPNTLNLSFEGVDTTELLPRLRNIALSTGSACHDRIKEPSKVLTEMGIPKELALGAIRFSLGKFTKKHEIDYVTKEIKIQIAKLH